MPNSVDIIFMTNKEFLETLNNTKTVRRLYSVRNPPIPSLPEIKPKIYKDKNKVMIRYCLILFVCFFITMCFISPALIAYPSIGRSLMMGLPPMLFVALSWMGGAWYAFGKERHLFLALTLGMMPLRCGIGLSWASFVLQLPDINPAAFIFGMMVFWVAFTIPEISMFIELSTEKK